MNCPECNGMGETIYYVEVDRDENSVTVEQRKDICRTCNGSGRTTMTNADRIRAMSDEELAKHLIKANDCSLSIPFCKWSKECDEMLDNGGIPDEMCLHCMIDWLRQPVEVGNG